ncbi:MAG: FMN-binding negative transcriptional regulator [Ginsengibacter sp.]
MYKLPHFTEKDEDAVYDFMHQNSFAIIAGNDGNLPVATHVPLDIKNENDLITLTGHMMKNTDHHKAFLQNENVLVIFNGPHSYVSASWYEKKDVASTWNYIDVHARGKIKFTDEKGTKKIIESITDKYEGKESEAAFHRLSVDYVDRLVKAIIGFTIEVSEIGNVFKLSQNHESATRESIVKHLNERRDEDSHMIAKEMEKRF